MLEDGTVHLLGRESSCINTGGEKVFAQEVELAVVGVPAVVDCLVIGAPDERFGSVVTAIVELEPGHSIDLDSLREALTGVIADYKLPRRLIVEDRVRRGPNGKADYGWARQVVDSAPNR
ncbi:MAG: AMP-binding enzyme [Ilumatobacteraceae bacterium]